MNTYRQPPDINWSPLPIPPHFHLFDNNHKSKSIRSVVRPYTVTPLCAVRITYGKSNLCAKTNKPFECRLDSYEYTRSPERLFQNRNINKEDAWHRAAHIPVRTCDTLPFDCLYVNSPAEFYGYAATDVCTVGDVVSTMLQSDFAAVILLMRANNRTHMLLRFIVLVR